MRREQSLKLELLRPNVTPKPGQPIQPIDAVTRFCSQSEAQCYAGSSAKAGSVNWKVAPRGTFGDAHNRPS